ncbi:MAG: HlyD family secretion protein [Burkholderiaceae bacterium]|nr:HlyD family secretion protein [Burkholderiaceae bacterium]
MKSSAWISVAVLASAAIAAAAWWFMRNGDNAATYRTAAIERGALQAVVSSSGTINPVRQVSVGSQVSGQIVEMFADFNTEVKKGQLIARLDPQVFEYKVRQAGADLEAARAAVVNAQAGAVAAAANVSKAQLDADNARRDLARKEDLLAQAFISQAEFETARNLSGTLGEALKVTQAQLAVARAQVTSAQAAVKQREAALAQAKVDLERTEIRSPVDGIVIKRSVDVGQTVAASLQAPELFIIARNLSDMQVEAAIDEADVARVHTGQRVTFTLDAVPGRTLEGRVEQIRKAALSAQNVVTYTVIIPFDNPGNSLLPGMTANVRIVVDTRENVLKVPNAALRVRIAGVEPAQAAASAAQAASAVPAGVAAAAGGDGPANGAAGRPLRAARDPRAAPGGRQTTRGRIYLLGDDGRPVAYGVRLGIGDGLWTELVVAPGSAEAGVLKEGAKVIVGVDAPEASRRPRSPF